MTSSPIAPLELFATDRLVGEEDRAIRDTVRKYVEAELKPELAGWYESAVLPARELAKRLGSLGVLGHAPRGLRLRGHQRDGVRPGLHGAARPATPASARWSRCRARSRCSRSGATAARSRSRSGCRGWRRGRRSAASGSPSPTAGPTPASMRTRARRDGDRLGPRRQQDVDHQRLRRRRGGRLGPRPTTADPRLRRAHGHPRLQRPGDQAEDVAARLGHLRAGARRRPAAGRRAAARGRRAARSAVAA